MTTIRIAAVGDLLMWRRQIASARSGRQGVYSFDRMFKEVAPVLRSADLTIANLETTLSGREQEYQKRSPKTGWPMFNCPDELAGALKRAGIDVVTTANNHCLDRGLPGLKRTIGVLERHGIAHTGTYRTPAEARALLIKQVHGVRVGILAYTYGTNGFAPPRGSDWAVNYIRPRKMAQDLHRIRTQADVVVVALHFGQEFHSEPSQRQKQLVRHAFQNGADIVLGAHPHVLQPAVWQQVRTQAGSTKRRFAVYSLGNFISDRMVGGIRSDSGAILQMDVDKQAAAGARVLRVSAVPTWVHRYGVAGATKFRVLPIRKFLSAPDRKLSQADIATMREACRSIRRHLKL